jgi:hypothetical protein
MRHRGLRFGTSSMISVELAEAPWLGAAFKLREFKANCRANYASEGVQRTHRRRG